MRRVVKNKLPTNDLIFAIERALDLWSKATTTESTRLHLHAVTTHADAVRLLAGLLPRDCRGFSPLGSNANLTAGETGQLVEQSDAPKIWALDAELCSSLGCGRVAEVLTSLVRLAPGALRQSSVSIRAENLRWPGAPKQSTGGFALDDAKAFRRKVRFNLSAWAEWTESSRPEARRICAGVREATGLDFSRSKSPGKPAATTAAPFREAEACVLFDHCLETVSRRLIADGFEWSSLAGVSSDGEGIARRLLAHGRAPSEKFRWENAVTTFIDENFPEFRKANGLLADALSFLSPVQDGWSIALIFDKHPGGRIGRVFKVRCGVVADSANARFLQSGPVLRCEGGHYNRTGDNGPEFSFDSLQDLQCILTDLRAFLSEFLLRFRSEISACFLPGLVDINNSMPTQGAITCLEALRLAKEYLGAAGILSGTLFRASLIGCNGPLRYRLHDVAQCPVDGRLTIEHAWEFGFDQGEYGLIATVPFAGHIRIGHVRSRFWRDPSFTRNAIPSDIPIDSAAITAECWRIKTRLMARYPKMTPLVGMPQLTGTTWTIHVEFSCAKEDQRGWVITTSEIDAATARVTNTLFDERFPDRAETQTKFVEKYPATEIDRGRDTSAQGPSPAND